MRNKYEANHVLLRNENYYFIKRVPCDLKSYYSVKRLCFSLKTKSYSSALRISKSVLQRLDDYWFGIRLKNMYLLPNNGSPRLLEKTAILRDELFSDIKEG
jgi:hypothetical protein